MPDREARVRDIALDAPPVRVQRSSGRQVVAVIGIDRYAAWPLLTNAVSDARGALRAFEALGFETLVEPLFNERATAAAIRRLVTDDLANLDSVDSLVLFFAGHGHTRARQLQSGVVETGFMIPVDGDSAEGHAATWLRLDTWLSDVARLPARHILVILDACHSGIVLGSLIKWRGAGAHGSLDDLHSRQSRRVITSALGDQRAMDSGPIAGHSLFTGCLIEALTGGLADQGRHAVTGSEIGLYIQRSVIAYTESQQTPDFGAFELDNRGELVVPTRPAVVSRAPTAGPSPGAPSPVARSAWDAVYERTTRPALSRSLIRQPAAPEQPAATAAAPVPWTSRLKQHAKSWARGFVLCNVAGAAIAAVISIFDAITPLHAFGGATLAVVVIAKGRVLESPQFLRSFTEAILGNKLRRGVSITAVVLGLLVGIGERAQQERQEKQTLAQAASNPDAERAAREAERTAERARASFNAAVAEADRQPDTVDGAVSAMHSYRCALQVGVLNEAQARRFAQRLRTIGVALLANNNYDPAISALEEVEIRSPTIDVSADLKRARAAQARPSAARPPLSIRSPTGEPSSQAKMIEVVNQRVEMVEVIDPKAGESRLECRPKRNI